MASLQVKKARQRTPQVMLCQSPAPNPRLLASRDAGSHKLARNIIRVPMLAQALATGTLEVDRGGVEEHELDVGEQVAPAREQLLLDHVLARAQLVGRVRVDSAPRLGGRFAA